MRLMAVAKVRRLTRLTRLACLARPDLLTRLDLPGPA